MKASQRSKATNKKSVETFLDIGDYWLSQITQKSPSAFNGRVSVRKYRVTVELVEEPDDVIRARIQKLWDECTNYHHWEPLKAVGRKYGMELTHTPRSAHIED